MERALSMEERIRRAEEVIERRNNSGRQTVTNINVSQNKMSSTYKKMIIQVLVCFAIYSTLWVIQEKKYIFSEAVLQKTNEILMQDINISWVCEQVSKKYEEVMTNLKEKGGKNEIQEEVIENRDETVNESVVETPTEPIVEEKVEQPLSQMELDVQEVKQKYKVVKPVQGVISSEFGEREETSPVVSHNHKGIDIAADEGTRIKAAIPGKVTSATYEASFGNYIIIENEDITTIYAHCKSLYVKTGDSVAEGQEIAAVGTTGWSTGPHLHFEIKKGDRHINPALLIDF